MQPSSTAVRPAPSPSNPPPFRGARPSWWQATLALGVLTVMVLSSAFFSSATLSVSSTSGVGASNVSSASSPGASELEAASAALEAGAGPAQGAHVSCASSTSSSGSVACQSTASPATVNLPSLAWNPVGTPLGRSYNNMVWDPADGYVVLFGGGENFADTWIFDHGTWTELHPAIAPSPRTGAYMVWDSEDNYVLLFGGYTGGNGPYELGDTWAFADGQWTEIIPQSACIGSGGTTPCPFPRDSGEVADDPVDGYVVLFSDYSGYQDTWTYAGGTWTDLIPYSSCAPTGSVVCPLGRGNGGMAWDPALGADVLFGGYNSHGGYNDTWEFSHGSWTELIAPSACTSVAGGNPCPEGVNSFSMTYDSTTGDIVIFGNYSSHNGDNLWVFNGLTWHEDKDASSCTLCPEARSNPGLVDYPPMGGVFMFGGYPYLGDSWLLYQGNWTPVELSGTPGARWDASMAWDPTDNEVVLQGGFLGTTALGGTWTFSDGAWTELACGSACPSARGGASMAWDAKDGYVLLFGGQSSWTSGYLRDTWSFVGGVWTEVNDGSTCVPTTCPAARSNASMAWDGSDDEVVLFGGFTTGATYENDTWSYSGGTWSELIAPSACTNDASKPCPSPRFDASVASAPLPEQGVVLFGGNTTHGEANDTWLFRDGAWSVVASTADCISKTAVCPSQRTGAAMAYDPTINMDVLFGGLNDSTSRRSGYEDTWVFTGNNNSWTKDALYGASDRAWSSMAFDPSSGNLVLAGGWYKYGNLPDVWFLSTAITITGPTMIPDSIDLGQQVTATAQSTGGGYGSAWYTWQGLPPGCAYPNTGSATLTCTPTQNGTYYLSTVVTYSNGQPGETSLFNNLYVNSDPSMNIVSNLTVATLGHVDNLTANATGGTGPFSNYHWSGLPNDCLQPTSAKVSINCDPLSSNDIGTWEVTVSADDSTGYNVTSAPFALVIQVAPWSVAVASNPTTIDLGQSAGLTTKVTGAAGPFTYAWNGLPTGCAGSAATLTCTPTAPGTYAISATLTNPLAGTVTSAPVTLVVLPALGAASLTTSASSVQVGSDLSMAVTIAGGDAPYSYAWSGLPTGCLSANVPEISCATTAAGSFSPSVTVTDATGATSSGGPASVTVIPAATPWSVVLSASTTSLDLGQSTTFAATLVGASSATYTWVGTGTVCPTASGSSFSCKPSATGTFFIAVQATAADGSSETSNSVELTVSPALPSSVTVTASSSSVTVGSPLTISALVTGGAAPYAYSWSDVPAGCPTADTPVLTCDPTSAGSYSPAVTVTDAVGSSATGTTTLTVTAAAVAPSGFAVGASGLDWTTFVLVLIVALIALGSLLLSLRGGSGGTGGAGGMKRRPEWDESSPSGSSTSPASPATGPSSSTPPPTSKMAPAANSLATPVSAPGPAPAPNPGPSSRARFGNPAYPASAYGGPTSSVDAAQ